jgi:hypothetical protein
MRDLLSVDCVEHSRRVPAAGGDAEHAAVENQPQRIAALTAEAIQQAAQTYLDTRSYVKVTLMPEAK